MNYKTYFEVLADVFAALNAVMENYESNEKRYRNKISETTDDDTITYYEGFVSEYNEKYELMKKIYNEISKSYIKEVK